MIKSETIEVNEKIYTLQHPGNREWLKLKKELIVVNGTGQITLDNLPMLDYCFEHVVFPDEGPKLSVDTIDLEELEEVWIKILPPFLRGQAISESYLANKRDIEVKAVDKPE